MPRTAAPDSRGSGALRTRRSASRLAWTLMWIALAGPALASDETDLQKPPPDPNVEPFRERLTALVKARYPQLLAGDLVHTPVLTVLFNSDGTIARSDLEISAQSPNTLTATEMQFARFRLGSRDLQYIGAEHLPLPGGTALVIVGARSAEKLDRALAQRYFPKMLTQPVPQGETPWILFDHKGRVLKVGQTLPQPGDLKRGLELRYPGIHISETNDSAITGGDGRAIEDVKHVPLLLHCAWLAPDSPLPQP
jgi:hypothetical protein